MTTTVLPTSIGAGVQFASGLVDELLYVLPTSIVISTDDTAIEALADNRLVIDGLVFGDLNGIVLGGEVPGGNVIVSETGSVGASDRFAITGVGADGRGDFSVFNSGEITTSAGPAAIALAGRPFDPDVLPITTISIYNENLIANSAAANDGVGRNVIDLAELGAVTESYNAETGVISTLDPEGFAIAVAGLRGVDPIDGEEKVSTIETTNAGEIVGGNAAYRSTSFGIDLFTNTGTGIVTGVVDLGRDDDVIVNAGQIFGLVTLGQGNDTFRSDGGTVIGQVSGRDGDDTFIIDDAAITLQESPEQGIDEVQSSVGWTLGENFENLTLTGDGAIFGVGNTEDNVILGNESDNAIEGRRGRDTIEGGDGNDEIRGGDGFDQLNGDEGDDVIRGQNGNDRINGGQGDDRLRGNAQNDTLNGDAGDDTLIGGTGEDRLTGGDGVDIFRYKSVDHSTLAQADRITDFTLGEDILDLEAVVPGPLAFVGAAAFSGGGAAEVRVIVVGGTDNRVLVDRDGDGAADMQIDALGTVGITDLDMLL
jgi:Ca2+-binding RTX toxin-like protein